MMNSNDTMQKVCVKEMHTGIGMWAWALPWNVIDHLWCQYRQNNHKEKTIYVSFSLGVLLRFRRHLGLFTWLSRFITYP